MSPRLFSTHISGERYDTEMEDAVDGWFEQMESRVTEWPETVVVTEWSTLPKGDSGGCSVMSGEDIAELVVERFLDDAGFEELVDDCENAARSPDVIAAFEAARALLVSKQRFLVSDQEVAKHSVLVFDDGTWRLVSTDYLVSAATA